MPERFLYDFLADFIGGINSDVPPLVLPKNVAAWTTNATLRGGFVRPRPPRFLRALNFPSEAIQIAVETGLFQGAGYYRPDFGSPQFVAQISGRLFTFTEIGSTWTVAEITIPGDPNDASTAQVWMNQMEKWLGIWDGSAKLPIFWDGVTARRSYGPSQALGTTVASGNFPTPRVIGEIITVNLTAAWSGPYDIPVLFNGHFYQTKENNTQNYGVILTNLAATPGAVMPSGSQIEVRPDRVGYNSAVGTVQNGTPYGPLAVTLNFSAPHSLTAGESVIMTRNFSSAPPLSETWSVYSTPSTTSAIFTTSVKPFPYALLTGTIQIQLIQKVTSDPIILIATTAANFTNPVVSGTVPVTTDQPYTGTIGQVVWIGTEGYTIEAAPPPAPGSVIYLINLDDTTDQGVAIPSEDILSVPELPAGRMGAYGKGRQCMSLTDGKSFIYGDIVGGPSGTPANNYRDAVLKTTELDFLPGGGSFKIPTAGEIITAMIFTAVLDAAYGQGPLEICTTNTIFTCAVPADLTTLTTATSPILTEALIGLGPQGQNSTILANSDTLFRQSDGDGSLIFGRRDFETWGNTPISTEVNRVIEADSRSLLSYGSAVTFDNRKLETAAPEVSSQGTCHLKTLALNFDPVSSLRGKAPSIWESEWTGLKVLQYVKGIFNGAERCFAFACNATDNTIEFWEQLRSDSAEYYDNGTDRIAWTLETPCIFKPSERGPDIPIVRLTNGKIHIKDVRGEVTIAVSYKPDFHADWTPWITLTISDQTDPGYLSPLGLGEPPPTPCDGPNNRPFRSGRFFQIRYEILGQCTLMGQEFAAVPEPTITFPNPRCGEIES